MVDDDDSDTLSMSLKVDFDKIKQQRNKLLIKNKEFVFVTEDGKTAVEFEEDSDGYEIKKEEQNQHTKPKMSYAQLIAEALLTGTDRMLTLNEIYIAINKKHPYYSLDAASGRNWQNAIRFVSSYLTTALLCNLAKCQNSINFPRGLVTQKQWKYNRFFMFFRHNLTLNKAFIKVPRPATEGRGAYWKLEAGAESQIFRRMARNYSRPKTLSLARHNIYFCDTSDINTVFITVPATWTSHEKSQTITFNQFEKTKKKLMLVQIYLSGSQSMTENVLCTDFESLLFSTKQSQWQASDLDHHQFLPFWMIDRQSLEPKLA